MIALMLVSNKTSFNTAIQVTWVDNIKGNFSFAKQKSIVCDAWCYEWAGTNSITAKFKTRDTVICQTGMNEATHCSLHLIISKDSCVSSIDLLSVAASGRKVYPCKAGYIKIDKSFWDKKILKAAFSFDFINDENDKRIFWNGKICTRIK